MGRMRQRQFAAPGICDKTWPDNGITSLTELRSLGWVNWDVAAFPDGSDAMNTGFFGVHKGGLYMRADWAGILAPYACLSEYIPNGGVLAVNNGDRINNDLYILMDYSATGVVTAPTAYGVAFALYDGVTGAYYDAFYLQRTSVPQIELGDPMVLGVWATPTPLDQADVLTNRLLLRVRRVDANTRNIAYWLYDRNLASVITGNNDIIIAGWGNAPIFTAVEFYYSGIALDQGIMRINELQVATHAIAYGTYGAIVS